MLWCASTRAKLDPFQQRDHSSATKTDNLRGLTAERNTTQNKLPRAAGVALGAKDKASSLAQSRSHPQIFLPAYCSSPAPQSWHPHYPNLRQGLLSLPPTESVIKKDKETKKDFQKSLCPRGTLYVFRRKWVSKGSKNMLTSHPEKAGQLKRECNSYGLMLLRSTSKYFLDTYHRLRPAPFAVGEEAKRRMHNYFQTVILKPLCAKVN